MLFIVFISYALVDDSRIAVGLCIVDHVSFAMAIAVKTYVQKIVNQKDFASTAGVSFTKNHIAALLIPAILASYG